MNTKQVIEKYDGAVMHSYGRHPIALERGAGATCVDIDGAERIDFGSGIGTNSLGFADKQWAEAVAKQAASIQHISNYYYGSVTAQFADMLKQKADVESIFFGNSGAEANECAIKLARKYSFDKYGKGRHTIITLKNSFHGRTMATLAATGQEVFHNYFFPFPEGFKYVEANNIPALRAAIDETVCAIMFEFVQGEGGVCPLDKEFVDEIFAIAAERDILTVSDEVQTGVGRTGFFLAAEHYGVKPDIVTLAKGLGGGLPIGVCMAREKCAETLTPGTHGSTFGGNPVVCAGAVKVLERLGEDFLEAVREKGERLRKGLLSMSKVTEVTGLGMMLGAQLEGITAAEAVSAAEERGVLCLTAKDRLRLLPPLTITDREIDAGMSILRGILS